MEPLVLPPGYLRKTDEDLGRWLASAWMAYMADTSGIPRDAIPQKTVIRWIEYGQGKGAGLIHDAQLESALRKAFGGDIVGAGKRVREHFTQAAALRAIGPSVTRDQRRQRGSKLGGKTTGDAAKANAAGWQVNCTEKARGMLKQGRGAHELAGILAERFHKTPKQVRTVLQAAGVLHAKKRK